MNIIRKLTAVSGIGATLALSGLTGLPAGAQTVRHVIVHHTKRHHTIVRRVVVPHHPGAFGLPVHHYPAPPKLGPGHHVVTHRLPMHTTVVHKTVIRRP